MTENTTMTNKYEVLLLIWKHTHLLRRRNFVLFVSVKKKVPNRHKQPIVRFIVLVMTKMKFRCVKKVANRRILAFKQPSIQWNISVTECVHQIEQNQVSTDNNPVVLASEDKRGEKCRTKHSNINEMFLKVLHKTG